MVQPAGELRIRRSQLGELHHIGGRGGHSGFYLSTGVEHANLASPSTPTYTVHATAPFHQNEWNANPPWPWMPGYLIEPLSDKHGIVFVVNPPTCRVFETYADQLERRDLVRV